MKNYGAIAQDWLSQLAQFSETQEGVTRRPFTVEHRKTLDQLTIWMEQAGLEVRLDNAGTLIDAITAQFLPRRYFWLSPRFHP